MHFGENATLKHFCTVQKWHFLFLWKRKIFVKTQLYRVEVGRETVFNLKILWFLMNSSDDSAYL